jgi:hypothetical protein
MRAFCERCKKDVEVDPENPRCPTCLRQSSLVMGEAPRPPSTPPAAPPPKAGSLGLALGGFALLLLSMVSLELTSWMTLTDACFVVGTVGGLFGMWRSGFFSQEPKATASKTALTIGGFAFGLLAAFVFWGALALLVEPLAPQTSRRFGLSHNWGLATMMVGLTVVIGQLSRALLVKRFAQPPAPRSKGALVPLAGAGPNLTEARDYRDGAKHKTVTLAEAAEAIGALPGVKVRVDGLRLVVSRKADRAPMILTVADRAEIELGKASIETSDEFLAVAVSHALLPLLGPHALELEGDVIAIDGTLTREELDLAHLQRLGKRLERNQAELERQFERLKRSGR